MRELHVVGAGLSGLSCALEAVRQGAKVTIHEAAGQAGGRCRSYFDPVLQSVIDNGNHLALSANRALRAYMRDIGAADKLRIIAPSRFAFHDLQSGRTDILRPSRSPLWLWQKSRRLPGSNATDYLAALRLFKRGASVADRLGQSALYERLWRLLAESLLNTGAETADAALFGRTLARTIGLGEAFSRPAFFNAPLSDCLVDPAVESLRRAGAEFRFHHPLRQVHPDRLLFADQEVAAKDAVLALPNHRAASLVPGLPDLPCCCIVNLHFRLPEAAQLPGGLPLVGIVNGATHWFFLRDGILSATISAADALAERVAEEIAALVWSEAAKMLALPPQPLPAYRVIKEKRATIAQTPASIKARAGLGGSGFHLAGDWTLPDLPCTLEAAIRSGKIAARKALRSD